MEAFNHSSPKRLLRSAYLPLKHRCVRTDASFPAFPHLTTDDVIKAVQRLPDKSSVTDPFPTSILKQVTDLLSPYIAELFNRSLAAGRFPAVFRQAFITPIIKKPGPDATDVSSYRPISNLSVLSKLPERLVAGQLMDYTCRPPVFFQHYRRLGSGRVN